MEWLHRAASRCEEDGAAKARAEAAEISPRCCGAAGRGALHDARVWRCGCRLRRHDQMVLHPHRAAVAGRHRPTGSGHSGGGRAGGGERGGRARRGRFRGRAGGGERGRSRPCVAGDGGGPRGGCGPSVSLPAEASRRCAGGSPRTVGVEKRWPAGQDVPLGLQGRPAALPTSACAPPHRLPAPTCVAR